MSAAEKIVSLAVVRQAREQGEGKKRMQDGFVAIPNEVEDALLRSPLTRHQERVFRTILRKTLGYSKETDCIATSQIAAATGFDESDVRKAIKALVAFGMIQQGRRTASGTFYTPALDVTNWDLSVNLQTGRITPNSSPNGANHPEQTGEITPHNRQLQQTKKNTSRPSAEATPVAPKTKSPSRQLQAGTSAKLVELYHQHCPSLPRISLLSDARRQALKTRWLQAGNELGVYDVADAEAGLAWWAMFFQVVEASDFLAGRVAPSVGREKAFRANLDWLLTQRNFVKVIEGNYENGRAQ